jgi:type IV pilus assembly protein PilA
MGERVQEIGRDCAQESLKMRRKERGFSLIELLIVVAIILIVAAVAVPNLLRSRMSANEASAVASMRTVITSEIVYSATYIAGFSQDLTSLSDGGTPTNCIPPAVPSASSACLLDSNVASGTKNGYIFTYAASGSGVFDTYSLNGDPGNPGAGQRHFYSDQTNVLRVNNAAVASSTDPAL